MTTDAWRALELFLTALANLLTIVVHQRVKCLEEAQRARQQGTLRTRSTDHDG